MPKEEDIKLEGEVVEVLAGGRFRVRLPNNHLIIAHQGGKIRMNKIRVIAGDRVLVNISPYDLNRGRITYRFK